MIEKQRSGGSGGVGFYWSQFRRRQKFNNEGRSKGTPFFSAD